MRWQSIVEQTQPFSFYTKLFSMCTRACICMTRKGKRDGDSFSYLHTKMLWDLNHIWITNGPSAEAHHKREIEFSWKLLWIYWKPTSKKHNPTKQTVFFFQINVARPFSCIQSLIGHSIMAWINCHPLMDFQLCLDNFIFFF